MPTTSVRVKAWNKCIGLLELINGKIYFEYTEENQLNFSPLKLKDMKSTYEFSHLSYQKALPGLIYDYLPGIYGTAYMDMFFIKHNKEVPSTLDRLLFIGNNSLGVLSFEPREILYSKIDATMNLKELYASSKEALTGVGPIEMSTIVAISNSAGGGARAKAIVGYNPQNNKIYIGHKKLPAGFIYAIIKFDEKNLSRSTLLEDEWIDSSVHNKTEYAYYKMAKLLEINISNSYLTQSEDGFHFVTQRFDRDKEGKLLHMHSLAGLFHHNPAETTFGYENLFRAGRYLNIPFEDFIQIYKILVFNLVFGNRDDHTRNFSFLMREDGTWRFAPAYDLTFSLNRSHQMLINYINADVISKKQLVAFGIENGIDDAKKIIENTIEVKEKYLRESLMKLETPSSWIEYLFDKSSKIHKNLKGE
ncbi:MAG: HipA domain-containing protein [Sulfurimonas sp.]|nr:HipA domain-containing protein [Sulfurimonas sp.]